MRALVVATVLLTSFGLHSLHAQDQGKPSPSEQPVQSQDQPNASAKPAPQARSDDRTIVTSEAALCILLSDEPKTEAFSDEIDVQTLISSPIFRRAATTLQVFEVYPPAPFVRRIGCKVMLRSRRPLADPCYILPDLYRQSAYVMRIPRVILVDGTANGTSRKFGGKQNANS
jgi:hypothetical protein